MKLVFHAPNVHQGGGGTLLRLALQGVGPAQPCVLIADRRFEVNGLPEHIAFERFAPTIAGRLSAELRLGSLAGPGDAVLCMGNLPPLFSSQARVLLFLQNRYLCENLPLHGFGWRTRLRIAAERIWLRQRLRSGMRILVQTATMRQSVQRSLGTDALIMPFAAAAGTAPRHAGNTGIPRFLYPASAEPHKNHATLIEAWRLLRQQDVSAELHLTIDRNTPLAATIEHERARGLSIVNHGQLAPADLAILYRDSTALIFPSLFESYGLPLLEAQAAGLPIVAAERDYVRDSTVPAQTFDPESPLSIARAVRRLLGNPDLPEPPLSPEDFIMRVVTDRG